jgi:hypothetical protein
VKLFKKRKSSFYWFDFAVRGQRYPGSTQETNYTRGAKIAALKLARAVEGNDPLPKKLPALSESYKRGCQGKNSPPPLCGDIDVVACIQPHSSPGGVLFLAISVAQLMVPIRRFHDAMARHLQFRKAMQAKALAKVPTMILCETRGLQLFWVVRGGIGLKRRLPVLNCQTHGAPNNLPDTLPRTRASQEPMAATGQETWGPPGFS